MIIFKYLVSQHRSVLTKLFWNTCYSLYLVLLPIIRALYMWKKLLFVGWTEVQEQICMKKVKIFLLYGYGLVSCVHACKAYYVWWCSQGLTVSPCSSYLWQWQNQPEEVYPLIKHLYPVKQCVQLQSQHWLWHQGLFWSEPPRFSGFSKGGPLFRVLLPLHSLPLHQDAWC